MMILESTSQSIKKDSVTVAKPIYKNIVRKERKCDSIYKRYKEKSVLLDDYISKNILKDNQILQAQDRADKFQKQLTKKTDELIKVTSRKNNGLIYGGVGVAVGVIVGVLISK